MTVTALYVAYNEEARIAESIRSVKAYVDRVVVVDGLFKGNPAEGLHSTDRQREAAEHGARGVELVYLMPHERLAEHEARNLALSQVALGDWAVILDADEVLYGDHRATEEAIRRPAGNYALRVWTTAVLANRSAPDIDEDLYASAPLIETSGWQTKVVRRTAGLETRRVESSPGQFTYDDLYDGPSYLHGAAIEQPFVINHRIRKTHAEYQATYLWEVAQGARG